MSFWKAIGAAAGAIIGVALAPETAGTSLAIGGVMGFGVGNALDQSETVKKAQAAQDKKYAGLSKKAKKAAIAKEKQTRLQQQFSAAEQQRQNLIDLLLKRQ